MDENSAFLTLGRRLRLAVIGGGPGSFIGAMHRTAARLDDQYEIVAAVLSSNAERSKKAAQAIGVTADRAYGSAAELISAEAAHAEGADVIAIMTPNDTHFEYCMAALDAGFDVICDKPLSNTLDEALAIVRKVLELCNNAHFPLDLWVEESVSVPARRHSQARMPGPPGYGQWQDRSDHAFDHRRQI